LKSRSLRKGLSALRFPVTPAILIMSPRQGFDLPDLENSQIVTSLGGVDTLLSELQGPALEPEGMAEARSVLEGAKALTRPQKRVISDPNNQRPAAALAKLEAEIANFDERQRRAALVAVPGPQRIRGLAGSGKTVILAMRAAHLHLTRPEERILVTFFTRSLRTSLKNLITRFFRHYKDEDPDWNKIHIRHGWGAQLCRAHTRMLAGDMASHR
jgi:superfamily I DNA and RNA helicase